jgi:hypothetical protein
LNKHYLYRLRDAFGDGTLPFDCPIAFRMGRTPHSSLSGAEKEDLLLSLGIFQTARSLLCFRDLSISRFVN